LNSFFRFAAGFPVAGAAPSCGSLAKLVSL
jgi:hypothetical protein